VCGEGEKRAATGRRRNELNPKKRNENNESKSDLEKGKNGKRQK
jgi:hypothetical protein